MRYLFVFLLLVSFNARAQNSTVEVFRRHKFECDKSGTTPDVNICSREKANFADSLLKRLWKQKLKELDIDIQGFSVANLKRRGQKTDSSDLKVFKEQQAHSIRLKQKLVSSQHVWLKLRERNYEYALESCAGGTGCTAIANDVYLSDTLERISWLEKM